MKRIISFLLIFSIALSTFNISFAESEIIISGLYPIKAEKIRLMSFESNLDFDGFIQDEEYIFKNESDKAQNIEIGLNKDNGIRLPKVKIVDQEVQLRESKDKYSFNIDLDKGEYKKVELTYEIRVNNADEEWIKYNLDTLGQWYNDIAEVKLVYDLREYLSAEVDVSPWWADGSYLDGFNRFIVEKDNYELQEHHGLYVNINNKWKDKNKSKKFKQMREYAKNGEYIKALEYALDEVTKVENIYEVTDYIYYFAAEYYVSDEYNADYPKEKLAEIIDEKIKEGYYSELGLAYKIQGLTNSEKNTNLLDDKVILLNIEKQSAEPYHWEENKEELQAELDKEVALITSEVEELAPNSNIFVPKLNKDDIVKNYIFEDEYREDNEANLADYNSRLARALKNRLEELGATVIVVGDEENLLSNKERIDIANEYNVHLVISINADRAEQITNNNYYGYYYDIIYPADTYVKDKDLIKMSKNIAQKVKSIVKKEFDNMYNNREDNFISFYRNEVLTRDIYQVDNRTFFNWSKYPVVGIGYRGSDDEVAYAEYWGHYLIDEIVNYFKDKEVQAYYKNHPRELEKQELEVVKEKLKTGNKVTESEVMTEVEIENSKKNNSVFLIIGVSIVATVIAAILTFIVIKLIKRLRRKKNEQEENNSDSE